MAVSRNIEEQKKKLRAAVQNAQQAAEKKSSYTFTPKVGSSNSLFSELPKQEPPKQTVSVEAAKPATKKFVPSTVMGRVSGQQMRENMFTPKSVATVKAAAEKKKRDIFIPNTRLTSGANATAEQKPSIGKWITTNLMSGIGQFNRGLAATADFILPTAGDFGGDSAIDRVIRYYRNDSDRLQQNAAKVNAIKGGHWGTAGNLLSGTVAAVPQAVIAMMSGGSSLGANAIESTATTATGLGQTILTSAQHMAKNPSFWMSFAQTAGNSYDEAKADGASDLQATTVAMISSLINAGVEIGGGIETIPNEPRTILNWVKGMFDEGKEEVIQGIVEQATKKAVYQHNKQLFSAKDENAVVNPQRAGQEFMGGAAVGGVLGAGQMGAGAALDVYNQTTGIGQEIKNADAAESVVDTGLQSDKQTGARKYAEKLQNKQGKGKELTDWNVGRQYLKNVKAIQNEEQFINSLSGIVQTQTHSELYDDKGNELNGQYIGGENSRIDISVSGDTSVPATAKHEFTHAFKQIALTAYQAYENYVINAAMETNAEAVNRRLQFLKENYGYSDEVAREEIAAELTGAFNTKAAERIASGNVTLADKITSAIRTAKAQIRTAYSNGNYENSKGVQLTFEQLNNAEKLWNKALSTAAENGGQAQTEVVVRNSIVEINGRNGNYGKGVYLDTNIFDGIHPRNWNKTLTQYVYDNLAGTELTVYDDNGKAETISFAKKNERATKDGANNSHRVIDKLARTKGNTNILSVVHIDELLQTAKDIGNVNENSHQWLDDKGWNYRKAYVQDKNGNIYETVLNIAKARDGRNILYALSNTKKIDEGVVPSTRKSVRGSLTNRQPYNNIISENESIVKKSVKENAPRIDFGAKADINAWNEILEEFVSTTRARQGDTNGSVYNRLVAELEEDFPLKAIGLADDVIMNLGYAPIVTDKETQIYSDNFKNWFGDWQNAPKNASKVVNEDGTPKVVYHGTPYGEFTSFDTAFMNFGVLGKVPHFTENRDIAKVYSNKDMWLNMGGGYGSTVLEVYLNIKNPLYLEKQALPQWNEALNKNGVNVQLRNGDTNESIMLRVRDTILQMNISDDEQQIIFGNILSDMGYDGITYIAKGAYQNSFLPDRENETYHRVWAPLNPTQIKSATNNIGTFNPNNADIRYSVKEGYDISKLRDITKNTHSDLSNLLKTNPDIDRVSLPSIISQQSNFVKQNPYRRSVKEGNEYTPTSERKTLGQALNDHREDIINSEPVADYNRIDKSLSAKQIKSNILEGYKQRYDYDGQYFHIPTDDGEVLLHGGLIEKAADKYLHSDGEISDYEAQLIAGIYAIPDVIQNGKELGGFVSDKGYNSKYIGGLITIDGAKGDIGIAIRDTAENKSEVRTVRLLDGQGANISDIAKSNKFTPNADINEIVNSNMTDAEKRKALEDRVHFIPRGGRDLFAESQQKGKEHFDKMQKIKPSEYTEDDWKSYGEDFGTENMRRDMGERVAEAERRDRESFDERFNKAFPNSQYSQEDWDNLTEPVSKDYDWTKDGKNWDTAGEKPKTQAELDTEADETIKELMEERGVDSPDQLAEETVSREDTKKRNAKFYRTKEGIQTLGSRLYTDIVDDMHPFWNYNDSFEKTQTRIENGKKVNVHTYGKQNPYKMAMNAKDASSRSAYLVTDYLTDFDGNVLGKGLIDTIAEGGISKEDYGAFNEYLIANHALEWLDEKGGGKYKTVYEDDRLNNWRVVKKMVDAFENKYPNFKQAAENIYEWQRKLLKAWLVDTGVITQDQYNYLTETYPHYVPFYRETNVAAAGGNTGLANLDNPIKKAAGGRKRILNPIENIMYNAASYVNHASKHAVTKAAVDMYDVLESDPANNVLRAYWEEIFPKNPQDLQPTQFVKKGETDTEIMDATEDAPEKPISQTLQSQVGIRDGVVSIMDNGTMRYFQVHDKDFLNVLDNVRKGREAWLAPFAAISRARAALLTTFKPQFSLVTNTIRDAGTYLVNTTEKNKVKAIYAAATSYVDIAKKSEAYTQYKTMGGQYSNIATEGRNQLKKALNELNDSPAKTIKKVLGFIPNGYLTLGDTIESAPRLGEFKSTLAQGYDIHEAFYRAKDVTVNFSRGGKISKGLNTFSNFFNAAIQGSDKFFRQAKNNPTSMAVGMAGLALISLLKYGWDNLMKDDKYDEAWKDLSNYQKNNNWNFYIGGGKFVSIPKPRENAVLITAGEAAVDKFMSGQDDRFKNFFTDYLIGSFTPDGSIPIITSLIELGKNKDYRGVPIVSKELEKEMKEKQYDDNTTSYAKWIGEQSAKVKFIPNLSPKQIDHLLNNETGVIGTAGKTYFTPSGRKDKVAMFSIGLSNTFRKDAYYSTDMTNMFYTNKEDAEKQANSYPSADTEYLNSRYAQAGNVMGIINQMVKDNADNKSFYRDLNMQNNRWFKRAYTNYAAEYKDNPLGLSDEVYKEIKGLYDEDKSILELPKINGEIKAKIDGVQQTYTFDDPYKVMQYQKDLNNAIDSAYREVIKTAEYQTMDNADKAAALKKAKTDAANSVKEMYVANKGKTESAPQTGGAVEKPSQEAVVAAQQKKDLKNSLTETYVQKLSDDFLAVNPGKESDYSVDTMMKIEPKKVTVAGKEYEVSGEMANKIAAAAEDKFYDNIESFYSGDTSVEYLIGKQSNGKAYYTKNADGKKSADLVGKRYDANGSKRFNETDEGKIIFKLKEAAINAAAEEYADEIAGDTSSVAGATPSPQGEGSGEPMRVSSTRFRSTRRSSGGRRSSGNSGGSRSGGTGRGVSVQAANVSESAARRRALEQLTGRSGGNPTIAKAIRGLKLEPVKALKL